MFNRMVDVEQFLQSHGIAYVLHEHPAVFTCEDAEKYCGTVPGLAGKNLFLKNKKSTRYFLVILPADKRADLKHIAQVVGEQKVSFASPEALREKLGLEPGSVSPFGLLNDADAGVEVFIDREVADAEIVNFHPNRNTASLELTQKMFQIFLTTLKHVVKILD